MTTLDDKILDYLTGALDSEEAAEVEAMIAADPVLEAEVAFHRQILDAGAQLPSEEPSLEFSAALMDAAVDAMQSSKPTRTRPKSFWEQFFITFTHPALVGGMAVIMVAVVSVGLFRTLDLDSPSEESVETLEANRVLEKEPEVALMAQNTGTVEAHEEQEEDVAADEPVAIVAEVKEKELLKRPQARQKSGTLDSAPQEGVVRAKKRRRRANAGTSKGPKPSAKPAPAVVAQSSSRSREAVHRRGVGVGASGSGSAGGRLSSRSESPPAPSAAAADESAPRSATRMQTSERMLLASRQLGRFRTLRRARAKAASEMPNAGSSIVEPWERELLRLIQNKRSQAAVKAATGYLKQNPELSKNPLFIYLQAEALFGSGQKDEARRLAKSIKGHPLYGVVVNMLLEAIEE